MTELSPAAQAVLDAFGNTRDGEYIDGVWVVNERTMLAAALRAAADQTHPEIHIEDIDHVHQNYVDGWKDALDVILIIADELEAQS